MNVLISTVAFQASLVLLCILAFYLIKKLGIKNPEKKELEKKELEKKNNLVAHDVKSKVKNEKKMSPILKFSLGWLSAYLIIMFLAKLFNLVFEGHFYHTALADRLALLVGLAGGFGALNGLKDPNSPEKSKIGQEQEQEDNFDMDKF